MNTRIIIGIIVVGLIGIGGWYVSQRPIEQSSITDDQQKQNVITPTNDVARDVQDDTGMIDACPSARVGNFNNWPLFTNTGFGYTVKHPTNAVYLFPPTGEILSVEEPYIIPDAYKNYPSQYIGGIRVAPYAGEPPWDTVPLNQGKTIEISAEGPGSGVFIIVESYSEGPLEAGGLCLTNDIEWHRVSADGHVSIKYWTIRDNLTYSILGQNTDPRIVDIMISTFRFTE